MKKYFLIIFVFLFALCITANAQWVPQYTFPNCSWIWQPFPVDENIVWGEIDFLNGNGGFFKTTDGGNNWLVDTLPNIDFTTSIQSFNASTAYYSTRNYSNIYRILKTTDGGITWAPQSSAFNNNNFINFIHFFDENNGCVVGDPSSLYLEIYTTTNAGEIWNRVPNTNIPISLSNSEYGLYRSHTILSNTIWVPVAFNNANQFRIFKSTNSGYNWSVTDPIPTSSNSLLPNSTAFHSQLEGLMILSKFLINNSDYKIIRTTDGGSTWQDVNFSLPIKPAFIWCVPGIPQAYIVTAPLDNPGSAYTLDGGNTWSLIDNSFDLCLPKFTSPSNGVAASWGLNDMATIYKWSGPPLPVELTSFTATSNGKEIILNWSTASELNNLGFEIQRSFEGSEFATVGVVYGKGTTTERRDYSYSDKNLVDGKYFYRLKQIDYIGSYEYSDVLEVDYKGFNSYLLEQNYPNPFNPITKIGFGVQNKSAVKISVLNSIGAEVAVVLNEERELGYHQVEFNAANLPSGVYFYRLQAGEFIQTKKMILLK